VRARASWFISVSLFVDCHYVAVRLAGWLAGCNSHVSDVTSLELLMLSQTTFAVTTDMASISWKRLLTYLLTK